MEMKRLSIILAFAFILTFALAGCTKGNQPVKQTENKKAAIIFGVGGLGDQSYNDLAYEGMKKAEKELNVKFDYAEPKAISDIEVQLREMARDGLYSVIISVGFDHIDPLQKVAKEYPNQKFAILDGNVDLPNVASYVSKEEEGSFLVGALAGLMKLDNSKYGISNKPILGFVGGLDIPIIRKFDAGFVAGAKYVNPSVSVLEDFVGGFSDVTTAKEIALTMNSKGADLIYHAAGGSGMGVFQAGKEKNFICIGVNSNQNILDPDHIVASMLKRVDVAAYDVVKEATNGSLKTGTVVALGLKDDGIGYTTEGSNIKVPSDVIDKLEAIKKKIISGELVPPQTMDEVNTFLSKNK